ncbi:efflux RND transporter periplasmic adaptor subunit [Oceanicoccus sp. KOV_DT_Chl]|uniref:efflux RND transporter periplasmic adaptor subunit n=1 Tax=Oceanicoccus sp. KOV_DT_Chl TaxID=1904639 RepID=UPI000C7D6DB4|nr:efflux RND transporter periplasmic adaptor subunit [Oceanicoccus sp. KOV_DT_Chl]
MLERLCCSTIIPLLLSSVLLASCSDKQPVSGKKIVEDALQVQTLMLQPQHWRSSFDSYGYLESTETVDISIDFSGTVREVNFKEGEVIRAGQVLIRLDRKKQELKLKQAEAYLESAKAELSKSQSTYQRHRNLVTTGALSQEQFKQSEANFTRAAAALSEAEAALALAQQDLRETTIISPVDGIVDQRNAEPGQTVLPGNSLAVVEVTDTLRAVTYVSQREVNLLRLGEVAAMTCPGVPGREYIARVELVGNSADPQTGNFEVKLTVGNNDRQLRAGMSVRLRLKGMLRENTILIPEAALVDRNRRRVVFRIANGRAQEVEPMIGVGGDGQIPIFSGLRAGDQLILGPLPLLQHGSLVTSKNSEDTSADTQPYNNTEISRELTESVPVTAEESVESSAK